MYRYLRTVTRMFLLASGRRNEEILEIRFNLTAIENEIEKYRHSLLHSPFSFLSFFGVSLNKTGLCEKSCTEYSFSKLNRNTYGTKVCSDGQLKSNIYVPLFYNKRKNLVNPISIQHSRF
jgi:hypothetical protein